MLAIRDSNHYDLSRNTKPYYLKREYGFDSADILKQIFFELDREETSVFLKFPWAYINFKENEIIHSTACWKIHVSATLENYQEVFSKVSEYALKYKINFKFTSSLEAFRYINSKQISPVSAGKFIVLYPLREELFETVLEDLNLLLKGYEGPVILSDRVYKDSKNIYYRYGEYRPIYKLSEKGNLNRYILDDQFNYKIDVRKSYYYCPDWIEDKYYSYECDKVSLLLQKYNFTEIITNRGSVTTFKAYDIKTNQKVFIKEARKYLGLDSANYYSSDRLRNEYSYLSLLVDTGLTPRPIEFIEEQGNVYLIEEFLEEESLASWLTRNNHLFRSNCSKEEKRIYLERVNTVLINIVKALITFKRYNLFLNDISVHNILVNQNLNVFFIDFEYAYLDGDTDVAMISTPGFNADAGLEGDRKELSKIIKLLLSLFIPLTKTYEFFGDKIALHIKWYLSEYQYYLCKETRNLFHLLINSKLNDFSDLEKIVRSSSLLVIENPDSLEVNIDKHIHKSIDGILSSYSKCCNEDFYFPADPHLFNTNCYGMAHGVFGVLYSLQKLNLLRYGFKKKIMEDIIPRLETDEKHIPGGLLYGYAGIAWSLLDLGYIDLAETKLALSTRIVTESFSFCYGLSGILLASINFYLKTRNSHYFHKASKIAKKLIKLNPKDIEDNGFGLGLSGIVYSLSYWYELNNDKQILDYLVMFMNEEIDRLLLDERGNIFINREGKSSSDKVYSPYVYDGIAGVGIALVRMYKVTNQKEYLDLLKKIIPSCFVELTVHASYMRGMAGIADFLLDTLNIIDDKILLENIENHINIIINNLELFFDDKEKLHFGEQLFKLSADLATGTSGVLLVLKRYQNFRESGKLSPSHLFNLDDLLSLTRR
ncbi:class III lanthionine synthetase LanKC N-terminal domain-containing protein [Streptococcus suis]